MTETIMVINPLVHTDILAQAHQSGGEDNYHLEPSTTNVHCYHS